MLARLQYAHDMRVILYPYVLLATRNVDPLVITVIFISAVIVMVAVVVYNLVPTHTYFFYPFSPDRHTE